jgi:hypothetical protein
MAFAAPAAEKTGLVPLAFAVLSPNLLGDFEEGLPAISPLTRGNACKEFPSGPM